MVEMGDRIAYTRCYDIVCQKRFQPDEYVNPGTPYKCSEPTPMWDGPQPRRALVIGWGRRIMADYHYGIDVESGDFGEVLSQQGYATGKREIMLYCKDEKPSTAQIFLVRLEDVTTVYHRSPDVSEPTPTDHILYLPENTAKEMVNG